MVEQLPDAASDGSENEAAAETQWAPPFESARIRATVVTALFVLGILLSLFSISYNLREFQLVTRMINGEPVTELELDANTLRQQVLFFVMLAQWLALVVAFLMWVHRAHRNLPALYATELQYTPRWAVLWYFLPLANLFRPYQVMREVANASLPHDAPEGGWAWRNYNAPILVKAWWFMFLLSNLIGSTAGRTDAYAKDLLDFQLASATSAVHETMSIPAAVLATWLVQRVTRHQEERAGIIAATG